MARIAGGIAQPALLVAAVALAAPAAAETVELIASDAPIEEVLLDLGGEGAPMDEDWTGGGVVEEILSDGVGSDGDVPGYDEWIAWSGVPLDEDGMVYTMDWDPDWLKRGGESGGDTVAPVPLPAAGLLLLAGLAGLGLVRRRG